MGRVVSRVSRTVTPVDSANYISQKATRHPLLHLARVWRRRPRPLRASAPPVRRGGLWGGGTGFRAPGEGDCAGARSRSLLLDLDRCAGSASLLSPGSTAGRDEVWLAAFSPLQEKDRDPTPHSVYTEDPSQHPGFWHGIVLGTYKTFVLNLSFAPWFKEMGDKNPDPPFLSSFIVTRPPSPPHPVFMDLILVMCSHAQK